MSHCFPHNPSAWEVATAPWSFCAHDALGVVFLVIILAVMAKGFIWAFRPMLSEKTNKEEG